MDFYFTLQKLDILKRFPANQDFNLSALSITVAGEVFCFSLNFSANIILITKNCMLLITHVQSTFLSCQFVGIGCQHQSRRLIIPRIPITLLCQQGITPLSPLSGEYKRLHCVSIAPMLLTGF